LRIESIRESAILNREIRYPKSAILNREIPIRIPQSIEEIFAPGFICPAKITDYLPVDVQIVGLRPFQQTHARFFGRAVPFSVVARTATRDQVIPRRIATS